MITIQFPAADGLTVTADYYKSPHKNSPVIIFCHQAGFSRGEYIEASEHFNNLGFHCFALDQRSGNEVNGIKNQTALAAYKAGKPMQYVDAVPDIEACIAYTEKEYPYAKKILVGSSYSSSLAIILGVKYANVLTAVAAFSPGEYLIYEDKTITDWAGKLQLPVFITSAKGEIHAWKNIFDAIPAKDKVGFKPTGDGVHGSRNLWESTANHQEYREAFDKFIGGLKLTEV